MLMAEGGYAGVSMYFNAENRYSVCTENGPKLLLREPLFDRSTERHVTEVRCLAGRRP